MGLFKSRKQSVEEQSMIDLINTRKKKDVPPAFSSDGSDGASDKSRAVDAKAMPPPLSRPPSAPTAPVQRSRVAFGIEQAIELVGKLPPESPKLTISVLTTTLESVNVSIRSIIEDANHKEAIMVHRLGQLQKEIARMEENIRSHQGEIAGIEAQLGKFREIRNRLSAAIGFSSAEAAESKNAKEKGDDDDLVA